MTSRSIPMLFGLIGCLLLSACFFQSENELISEDDAAFPFPDAAVVTFWSQDKGDPAVWTMETGPDGGADTGDWSRAGSYYLLSDAGGDTFQLRFTPLGEWSRTLLVQVGNPNEPGEFLYAIAMMGGEGRLYVDIPSPVDMDVELAEQLGCGRSSQSSCELTRLEDALEVMLSFSGSMQYEGYLKLDPAPEDAWPVEE